MHWYDGNIAEAVALSRQLDAIFVVFVEGDNDLSREMAASMEHAAVAPQLSNRDHFLMVKLRSGSENYTHFARIYQFVPVPSLFFIGRTGAPLEVVCAGLSPRSLADRLSRILDQHKKAAPVQPSTSSQNLRQQTATLIQSEAASKPAGDLQTSAPRQLASAPSQLASAPSQQASAPSPLASTPSQQASAPSPLASTPSQQASAPNPLASAPSPLASAPSPLASTPSQQASAPSPLASTPSQLASAPSQLASEKASQPRNDEPETSSGPAAKIAKTTHVETTKSGKEYEVVCDGDVCVRRPKESPDDPGPSQSSSIAQEQKEPKPTESAISVDDKVEKAKELIEARRREKAAQEKELEKQKEIERRTLGQGAAELKRWQADQELKLIQEERKREKLENNLARQRILEQIAQDRAERRARDAPAAHAPPPAADTAAPATAGDGVSARLQFKLPDGSSHTALFPADGSLGAVQRYLADTLQLSPSSYTLWTAFPRRELTDPAASLAALGLLPAAALLLLPRRAPAAAAAAPGALAAALSFITQLFTTLILTPSQQLYDWVTAWLLPPAGRLGGPRTDSPPRDPPSGPPAGVRRRGNVHRLPGEGAGEDDNNTWNGNSTQQM